MKIPFFLSLFIIFLVFYNIKMRKTDKEIKNSNENFLQKEREALFIRKKSLDDLDYIVVSLDHLPILKKDDFSSNYEKQAYRQQELAHTLASKPLLNLKGISNTDLKLQYGPANLETLISYEQNYTNLLKALLNWGKHLYEAHRMNEAIKVLEKAVDIGTDLSQNYILLADLYSTTNQKNRLIDLKQLIIDTQGENVMLNKMIQHIDSLL